MFFRPKKRVDLPCNVKYKIYLSVLRCSEPRFFLIFMVLSREKRVHIFLITRFNQKYYLFTLFPVFFGLLSLDIKKVL